MADVAARAQVDKAIVSKVLSGDSELRIRPDTRDRVLQAVEELGYRPNQLARGLRTDSTGTIGLIIPDFANPVYAEIIRGAEAQARTQGMHLLTASAAGGPIEPFDLLREGRVDGLLITGLLASTAVEDPPGPYLVLNNRVDDDRWVILDDQRGAEIAIMHLIGLGHRRIAHIAGPSRSDTARRRLEGYRGAMERGGAKVDERLIASGDYTAEGGAAALSEILTRSQVPPTAVFVANLISAAGVLQEAQKMGFAVPGDLSVVAIHDLPLAALLVPQLTTVSMPLAQLGSRGVELLGDPTTSTREIHEVICIGIRLQVRDSTAPAPTS